MGERGALVLSLIWKKKMQLISMFPTIMFFRMCVLKGGMHRTMYAKPESLC
jgi:hypothetical protein